MSGEAGAHEGFAVSNARNKWKKRFATFGWIRFIRKTINEYKPSNVFVFTLKMGAMTSLACNMKDRPRIVMREINDPKGSNRSQLMNRLLFKCSKRIDGVIFQTEWEKNCYSKKLQRKGKVIPNPVALDVKTVNPKRNVFFAMSSLEKHKAVDIIIRAFGIFSKDHPEYKLQIYGDGKERESLESLTSELHLNDKVIFMGARKDVLHQIKDAKGFVTASEHEGMSNSLLEAFLMGVPCISSDWHGVEDVGENGLLVKIGDVGGFANAFKRLAEDESLCKKLAANALKEWPRFDESNVFKQYCAMIEGE